MISLGQIEEFCCWSPANSERVSHPRLRERWAVDCLAESKLQVLLGLRQLFSCHWAGVKSDGQKKATL
jgi:hypothetical protein